MVIGPPDAGKSTLLKHVRMWSEEAWTDSELRMYGVVVRANVVEAMRAVCQQIKKHSLETYVKKDAEKSPIDQIQVEDKDDDEAAAVAAADENENNENKDDKSVDNVADQLGQSTEPPTDGKDDELVSSLPNGSGNDDDDDKNTDKEPTLDCYEAYQMLCDLLLPSSGIHGNGSSSNIAPGTYGNYDDEDDDDCLDEFAGAPTKPRDWVGYSPQISDETNQDAKLLLRHWKVVQAFWKSATVQELWHKNRAGSNIVYGHRRFLENLPRLIAPSFKPTDKDILWARMKAIDKQLDDDDDDEDGEHVEVPTESFRTEGMEFEFHDIGHNLTDAKRQWIEAQEFVFDAVIFVASLADFHRWVPRKVKPMSEEVGMSSVGSVNSKASEMAKFNRMQLAIEQFEGLCDDELIGRDKMLLMLNKQDAFSEKLMRVDIETQPPFRNFDGLPRDAGQGVKYFLRQFENVFAKDEQTRLSMKLDVFATSTADLSRSAKMKGFILDSLKKQIVADNLKHCGILF